MSETQTAAAKAKAEASKKACGNKPAEATKTTAQRAKDAQAAAKKQKDAEAAKKKAEASAAKLQAANAKWLARAAGTINGIIKRLGAAESKADDQRATLAVSLSEAEEVCKGSKLSFKEWAEGNILKMDGSGPYSYPELRRLTKIGRDAEGDETTARKALEDMRAETARRVREHAERKKEEPPATPPAGERETPPGAGHNGGPDMNVAANADPMMLLDAVKSMSAKSQLAFLEKVGEVLGLTIITTKTNRQIWPKS